MEIYEEYSYHYAEKYIKPISDLKALKGVQQFWATQFYYKAVGDEKRTFGSAHK